MGSASPKDSADGPGLADHSWALFMHWPLTAVSPWGCRSISYGALILLQCPPLLQQARQVGSQRGSEIQEYKSGRLRNS